MNEPKRKKVESTFADKWEPQNEGDELSGKYLGYEQAEGRKGEKFNAYQVLDANGKRWSISGAYLDSLLPQVPKGAHVWITFTGKKRMKNGDMMLFSLDVEEGVSLVEVLK
jgi:hypothetical protein